MLRYILSFFGGIFTLVTMGLAVAALSIGGVLYIYSSDLPSHENLAQYQPPTISRIYSREGLVMDEFARERRIYVPFDEMPDLVIQAVISAEDRNYFEHAGYDPRQMVAALLDAVVGTISAGPIADSNQDPAYLAFVEDYKAQFPDGFASPSLFAWGYFVNAYALLSAIEEVGGDLSDGQAALQAALADTVVDGPTGMISLDGNRQSVGNNYITEIVQLEDGTLISELVSVTEGVNQTLGVDAEEYLALGAFDRENPVCADLNP